MAASPPVGRISFGEFEEKTSRMLSSLLYTTDVNLTVDENYDYPKNNSGYLKKILLPLLSGKKISGIVFDLVVRQWPNTTSFKKVRQSAFLLQEMCSDRKVNTSFLLRNGTQPLGNAWGKLVEMKEAIEVLKGNGPLDLTKYVLEIGADLLLLSQQFDMKMKAKMFLREKILEGKASHRLRKSLSHDPSKLLHSFQKVSLSFTKAGFIHAISIENLWRLKSQLLSSHPNNGFILLKKVGDRIEKGEKVVDVYIFPDKSNRAYIQEFQSIFKVSHQSPGFHPFILERYGPLWSCEKSRKLGM